MRVLVVDDDPDLRMLMVFTLGRTPGLSCREAESGSEALLCLDEEAFDVVLLDVQMPGLSGLETLAAIRARPGGASQRVMLVTGREDRTTLEAAEADAIVEKPFTPERLSTALAELMGRA